MKVINPKIQVDDLAINPTLNCSFDLEFDYSIEIPISVSGQLLGPNNRVLTLMNEHKINAETSYGLRLLSEEEKDQSRKENTPRCHNVQLSAQLSQLALDSIENQRDETFEKSIKFAFDLIVKSLNLTEKKENSSFNDFIQIRIERKYINVSIQQSDWINNYSQKLGIGKFLLIELNIPDNNVSDFWRKLFVKLTDNAEDMEKNIRIGDWQKVIFFARKFFENIKIGDGKKGHEIFRQEFNNRMIEFQHSPEGISNLYDGIWKFFEFISKFSHEKDKAGNLIDVIPIPTKEDAYFMYALSIGLLSMMGKKMRD